jgi:hypothetical protein
MYTLYPRRQPRFNETPAHCPASPPHRPQPPPLLVRGGSRRREDRDESDDSDEGLGEGGAARRPVSCTLFWGWGQWRHVWWVGCCLLGGHVMKNSVEGKWFSGTHNSTVTLELKISKKLSVGSKKPKGVFGVNPMTPAVVQGRVLVVLSAQCSHTASHRGLRTSTHRHSVCKLKRLLRHIFSSRPPRAPSKDFEYRAPVQLHPAHPPAPRGQHSNGHAAPPRLIRS